MTSKNDPKHPKHQRKNQKWTLTKIYTHTNSYDLTLHLSTQQSLYTKFYSVEILESRSADLYFFNAGSSRGDSRRKIFTSDSICEK